MAEPKLKSYEFRREREASWMEFERLLDRAESKGLRSLSAAEMFRLPNLYRATVSSLSVARSISLDRNLLLYLESLAARGYFFVYGARGNLGVGVARFFSRQFPGAVREAFWHILASGLIMAAGAVVGYLLTIGNMDWFYSFVGGDMAGDRTPLSSTESLRAALYDDGSDMVQMLYLFATFLFTHNSQIGMLAFALGFALGLPVVLLMFYNGLVIGSFTALYVSRGLAVEFIGWLSIHGTTELLAVTLCGGAGFWLGTAFAFPGEIGRLDSLARTGRKAGMIAIGAVVMLFVAAILEGFGRQLILETQMRYGIGGVMLVLWLAYFTVSGRGGRNDRRG